MYSNLLKRRRVGDEQGVPQHQAIESRGAISTQCFFCING